MTLTFEADLTVFRKIEIEEADYFRQIHASGHACLAQQVSQGLDEEGHSQSRQNRESRRRKSHDETKVEASEQGRGFRIVLLKCMHVRVCRNRIND